MFWKALINNPFIVNLICILKLSTFPFSLLLSIIIVYVYKLGKIREKRNTFTVTKTRYLDKMKRWLIHLIKINCF